MELIKQNWTETEGTEFLNYLKTMACPQKEEWTRKIINTKMPMLAIATPTLKNIAKEICKGNFIEFLNLKLNQFYETIVINGYLIGKIKDFTIYKNYLLAYIEDVDNWANCDLLEYKITDKNIKDFFNLSLQLIKDERTFARRIAVTIWFKFINTKYLAGIFKIINNMQESEYYVNMCVAWFVAECFIKQKEQTLQFLNTNNLNAWTVNKAISKCRDSYRVTKEDKEMLLKFKKQIQKKCK